MSVREGDISFADSSRSLREYCLGLTTPAGLLITKMDLMSGVELCPEFGRLYMFSVVKTDENCKFKMFTLISLSSFRLSGATPQRSFFLFFLFQQFLAGVIIAYLVVNILIICLSSSPLV